MTKKFFGRSVIKRDLLGFSFALLVCLLMPRFVVLFSDLLSVQLPLRLFLAVNVIFVFFLPVVIVFILAERMEQKTSFFLPFFINGFIYPVCYALFLDSPALLLSPNYYITYLIGGVALGLIGLAGNIYRCDFLKSVALFSLGVTIILLKSVNLIPVMFVILIGNIIPIMNLLYCL